jgi:hypothetical protein
MSEEKNPYQSPREKNEVEQVVRPVRRSPITILGSAACFFVALVGAILIRPIFNPPEDVSKETFALALAFVKFVAWPMVSLGMGCGIGLLCGRFWWGLSFGILTAVVSCFL